MLAAAAQSNHFAQAPSGLARRQTVTRECRRVTYRQLCDSVTVDRSIRVGDTARRSASNNTQLVQTVLRHLEGAGVGWAPRPLGIDNEGREVVSWIPGATAESGEDVDVSELARMVRCLHDLTVDLVEGCACIIHDDLQPRNVVVRQGKPVGLIDWEQARPGRRVEDVANLCWSFVEPRLGSDCGEIGRRWRLVADAYGLGSGDDLVAAVLTRMLNCAEDIEREAGRGSVRHGLLHDRGDHVAIRAMYEWVTENQNALRGAIAT
jgi:aminoglycoside phosphotransferase (APT) family kinase protein